jgi:hypothetical protein
LEEAGAFALWTNHFRIPRFVLIVCKC